MQCFFSPLQELDLAAINSIGMAAATAATVWLLAPTRSYGSVHKFPWQQVGGEKELRGTGLDLFDT